MQFDFTYKGCCGISSFTADSIAYEPVQRLLAVSQKDGVVKLIGQPGVEVSLYSSINDSPTKQLYFVKNRAILVKITQDGQILMWDLFTYKELKCFSKDDVQLLSSEVSYVSGMSPTPYLLLGMESGNIRIVQLLSSNLQPADEGRQVVGYKLMQQLVNADQLSSIGNVEYIQPLISPNDQILVLALHSVTGVIIWDLKQQKTIIDPNTQIGDNGGSFLEASDKVLRCQWMDLNGKYFCTINNRFIIQVWRVLQPFDSSFQAAPPSPGGDNDHNSMENECQIDCVLQFSILDEDNGQLQVQDFCWLKYRENDNSLQQVFVIVLNDIKERADDVLIVKFPVIDEDLDKMIVTREMVSKIQDLPDFKIRSMTILQAEGSVFQDDEVQSILFLLENDRIYVYDPKLDKTSKYAPTFQMLCEPSCIVKAPSFLTNKNEDGGISGDIFIDHVQIQYLKRQSFAKNMGNINLKEWKKIASAGLVPKTYSESALEYPVAMVGHSDGFLRLWQFSSEQPQLLCSMPSSIEIFTINQNFGQAWFGEITQMEVDWSRGYVIAGTSLGEVFVFKYVDFELSNAASVEQGLGSANQNGLQDTMLQDFEEIRETESYSIKWMDKNQRINIMQSKFHYGFQLEVMGQFHYAQITAIAYDYDQKLLCLGDENGGVSITNLVSGKVLLDHANKAGQPKLAVSKIILSPSQEEEGVTSPEKKPLGVNAQTEEIEILVVFFDGSLKRLSKATNVPVTSCKVDTYIKPNNQSGHVLFCDTVNAYTGLNQQIYMQDWFRYHELQTQIYQKMGVQGQGENVDVMSVSTPKSSAQEEPVGTPLHSPAKKYLEQQRAQNSELGLDHQPEETIKEETTGDLFSDKDQTESQSQLSAEKPTQPPETTPNPFTDPSQALSQKPPSPTKASTQTQQQAGSPERQLEENIDSFLQDRGQDIKTGTEDNDPSQQAFRSLSQDSTYEIVRNEGAVKGSNNKEKLKNLSKNVSNQFRNAKGNLENSIKQRVSSVREKASFKDSKQSSLQSSSLQSSSLQSSPAKRQGKGLLNSFHNSVKGTPVLSQLFSNILMVQQYRVVVYRQGKSKLKEAAATNMTRKNDRIVWANIVVFGYKPLLVTITYQKILQIYTIPGLNLLYELDLPHNIPIDISSNVFQTSEDVNNKHLQSSQNGRASPHTDPNILEIAQLSVTVDPRGWILLFGVDQHVVVGALIVNSLQDNVQAQVQGVRDGNGNMSKNIREVMFCDPKQLFSEDLAAACSQTQQMLFQKNIAKNNNQRQQLIQKQILEQQNKQGVFGGFFNNMNMFARKNSQPTSRPMSPATRPHEAMIKKSNSLKQSLSPHLTQQQSLKKSHDIQPMTQQSRQRSHDIEAPPPKPTPPIEKQESKAWWSRAIDATKQNSQQPIQQPPPIVPPEQNMPSSSPKSQGPQEEYVPLEAGEAVEDTQSERDQLFAGAKTQPKKDAGGPQDRQKLIDDIKAKYGFQPKPRSDVGEVGNIARENQQMLQERGIKLGNIQDSAQDMANDAEDFASLATKLAERQKNRKWFGL